MNEREQYMLGALQAIATYGKEKSAMIVLRPYMDAHGIQWHNGEDVKTWMRRIADDAIKFASK
jgi:hypothetical protein